MIRRSAALLLLAAFPALAPAATAQDGGIELFAANTLFDRGTRVSLSYLYRRKGTLFAGSNEIPDPLGRALDEHRAITIVDHGLRPDLTVSALVPVVFNDLDSGAGDAEASGLGDVALLVKYRVYKHDWPRKTLNVSVVGGVETPTGRTTASQGGMLLPPGLQPGLGAWNPFAALASNVSLDRFRFDAHAFYKANTEGTQAFEKGDFFSFEVDGAYRFLHTKYPGPTASARLGLQWRSEDRARQFGAALPNSGSDELLLRPGLGWHPRPGIDVSLGIDIPIYQEFNGQQLGQDFRTLLVFGMRF